MSMMKHSLQANFDLFSFSYSCRTNSRTYLLNMFLQRIVDACPQSKSISSSSVSNDCSSYIQEFNKVDSISLHCARVLLSHISSLNIL